jgi:hypothetical protein
VKLRDSTSNIVPLNLNKAFFIDAILWVMMVISYE